jgi:L-fucose mutarotase
VLAEMGHGDEIVIADANFTATSLGRGKPCCTLPGVGVQRTCEAVLSLLPLDAAWWTSRWPTCRWATRPRATAARCSAAWSAALQAAGWAAPAQCQAIERFAFYDRVQAAHAIVLTGELQPYGQLHPQEGRDRRNAEP